MSEVGSWVCCRRVPFRGQTPSLVCSGNHAHVAVVWNLYCQSNGDRLKEKRHLMTVTAVHKVGKPNQTAFGREPRGTLRQRRRLAVRPTTAPFAGDENCTGVLSTEAIGPSCHIWCKRPLPVYWRLKGNKLNVRATGTRCATRGDDTGHQCCPGIIFWRPQCWAGCPCLMLLSTLAT
jgi:hypothetical protein